MAIITRPARRNASTSSTSTGYGIAANSEQTNPTRTNNPRDRDSQTQGSGLSEDFASPRQNVSAPNSTTEVSRLNQVIQVSALSPAYGTTVNAFWEQNFHTKAALIILHSRVDLAPAYKKGTDTKRVNRWVGLPQISPGRLRQLSLTSSLV